MSWREQSAWMRRRACRGMDPGPWFSSKVQDVATARAVCADCPVQTVCLSWALEEEQELRQVQQGMFGGKTPAERREMLGLKPVPRRSRAKERAGMTATRTLEMMEAGAMATRNLPLTPGCRVDGMTAVARSTSAPIVFGGR